MNIFWKRDKLHLKQPSDSVSGTLLGPSDPKITQSDPKVTLKWPKVTPRRPQSHLRVTQVNPKWLQSNLKVILKWPQSDLKVIRDPKVTQSNSNNIPKSP